jgi:hypothetical protein
LDRDWRVSRSRCHRRQASGELEQERLLFEKKKQKTFEDLPEQEPQPEQLGLSEILAAQARMLQRLQARCHAIAQTVGNHLQRIPG